MEEKKEQINETSIKEVGEEHKPDTIQAFLEERGFGSMEELVQAYKELEAVSLSKLATPPTPSYHSQQFQEEKETRAEITEDDERIPTKKDLFDFAKYLKEEIKKELENRRFQEQVEKARMELANYIKENPDEARDLMVFMRAVALEENPANFQDLLEKAKKRQQSYIRSLFNKMEELRKSKKAKIAPSSGSPEPEELPEDEQLKKDIFGF